MTRTQTLGLTSAYFGGGYLFGPLLVGEWVLRHDEHHRRRSAAAQPKRHAGRAVSSLPSAALAHIYANPNDEMIGGFKATFIVGLCIYGTGTIMFWPSAVLTSFPGFLISNFVVGFGLSILETAANPFLALCGPMEYSEMRLLLAQGLQGASSVVSGLLAQKVFFIRVSSDSSSDSMSLLDVQWTYLAITLFCAALAMFFYYMPLPEVYDAELERLVGRLPVDGTKRTIFGGLQLRTVCLILAVIAQWVYVASQECMSLYFDDLVTSWLPDIKTANDSSAFILTDHSWSLVSRLVMSSTTPADNIDNPAGLALSVADYLLISRTAFAVSRFVVGCLSYLAAKHPGRRWLPSPLTMLTISISLSALFALLCVVLRLTANANLMVIPVSLFFLAEGPIYPLIFAIGLRGQGRRTKRASAWLTVGASGPLFWPFVMYGIIARGGSVRTSFIVVVCLLAFAFVYPLYLTFLRDAGQLCKLAPTNPSVSSRRLKNRAEHEDGPRLPQDATQLGAPTPELESSGEVNSPLGHGDMPQLSTPPVIAHRPAGHPTICDK
ncbi:major facilitator superfamily transporter monosaccharide [Grosmannia clavigera kw1407]|uniref:Major facilitator superfamily transporter monosaccharide n=1 Tax=Grosmannia clavigera (strain kw1407 / UAMH 11150) TaxID=655863 RepID=F0XGT4_GROCL|nr:major facilitator superfamily transporter monosaccharide [Grosmannia clavigera kw1407]EFX02666.1 major facilitator superfamily transporter monosaccharide [Grosmannia clavigera kw1407]